MTLREFLEQRWAERRGRPIDEALTDFNVPVDGPDGISTVGAERIRDREIRWAERGLAVDGLSPTEFVNRLYEIEPFLGALWLDAFVAGAAFQRDARKAPPVQQPPTHICNSCGERIEYGDHAHGCPA